MSLSLPSEIHPVVGSSALRSFSSEIRLTRIYSIVGPYIPQLRFIVKFDLPTAAARNKKRRGFEPSDEPSH